MISQIASGITKTMTLSISYHNMEATLQAVVVHMVEKVAEIAYRNGGVIFGGYVRDVVIPRTFLKNEKTSFKDVDLWFRTQEEADQFYDQAKDYLRRNPYAWVEKYPPSYSFSRVVYDLVVLDVHIGIFDVIVSPEYPVNDFDVNSFSYDGKHVWYNGRGNISDAIEAIQSKQATITREYAMTLLTNEHQRIRVANRYLGRGWEICAANRVWVSGSNRITEKEIKSLRTMMAISDVELDDWKARQHPIRHEVVEAYVQTVKLERI